METNVFVSYVVTLFNKILTFHRLINESLIELITKFSNEFAMKMKKMNNNDNNDNDNENVSRYNTEKQQIGIKYLMNISMNFEQIIDTICKLLHLPFLSQQTILRRYIAIQCKIVFNGQIIYLFPNKDSNISLNKEYLSLFSGDPKLVEPLLTNIHLNNNNDSNPSSKSLDPSQIATNREVICSFIDVNFYSMSKIHVTIQDLLALPSIQISTKKRSEFIINNDNDLLFIVNEPIIDKYSGKNLKSTIIGNEQIKITK